MLVLTLSSVYLVNPEAAGLSLVCSDAKQGWVWLVYLVNALKLSSSVYLVIWVLKLSRAQSGS